MWEEIVFVAYMSIVAIGQENDGTYNYLLETPSKLNQKSISISLKDPFPYKQGERFIAKFDGECSSVWAIDSNWNREKKFICNAKSIETRLGLFKDLYLKEG